MMDVALFGAGRIGKIHGGNVVRQPGVRLKYVVDVNADRFVGVEPQAMNEIEIEGRETRRMGAEVVDVVAAAVVVDHQTGGEVVRFVRAFPRLAEQS